MEVLGENLISYEKVIEFLKTKGKGKNFFNTLRTRYKLIHKPIVKPPYSISILGKKFRKGRSIYYLKDIIPYLEQIIRLHEEEHLTFRQIEDKMRTRKHQLDELRRLELADDTRLKPAEFIDRFEIAKLKLKEYLGWGIDSQEIQFLDYISKERRACGKRYYELTKLLREATDKGKQTDLKDLEAERESFGRKLDFCHQIMEAVINQFKELLNEGKIKMTADDWKEIVKRVSKS